MSYISIIYIIGSIIMISLLLITAEDRELSIYGVLKLIATGLMWPIALIPILISVALLIAIVMLVSVTVLPMVLLVVIYLVIGERLFDKRLKENKII